MITIIDYGAGNLRSVEKAVAYLGGRARITADRDEIRSSGKVILPGVGSFGAAAKKLRESGLDKVVFDVLERGTPFLGICLGMQLLFEESEESPGVPGLGVLKGRIFKIPGGAGRKIPHMGWNSLDIKNGETIFKGVSQGSFVYFVHSFYARAEDREAVAATAGYGVEMDVAVSYKNMAATQFHPEKSSAVGLKILKNFIG